MRVQRKTVDLLNRINYWTLLVFVLLYACGSIAGNQGNSFWYFLTYISVFAIGGSPVYCLYLIYLGVQNWICLINPMGSPKRNYILGLVFSFGPVLLICIAILLLVLNWKNLVWP